MEQPDRLIRFMMLRGLSAMKVIFNETDRICTNYLTNFERNSQTFNHTSENDVIPQINPLPRRQNKGSSLIIYPLYINERKCR